MRRPCWRITSPSSGAISPRMSRSSVLLPSPLRPRRLTRSPRSICKSTRSSNRGPPKARLTSRRLNNAMSKNALVPLELTSSEDSKRTAEREAAGDTGSGPGV